jgi:hypothetical protein
VLHSCWPVRPVPLLRVKSSPSMAVQHCDEEAAAVALDFLG